VFILRQDLQTQEVHRISDQYKEDVKTMGAEIKKFEYWGFRSLCHTIKKNKKGHYLFYVINSKTSLIDKIIKKLKFRDDILRYAYFKTSTVDIKPSPMMQNINN